MSDLGHFRIMAPYNAWMNTKVYDAAERLTSEKLARDREAFFCSILGTLNHIAEADLTWLGRLAQHPTFLGRLDLADLPRPDNVESIVSGDIARLRLIRERIDRLIVSVVDNLTESDVGGVLEYRRANGTRYRKPLTAVLSHLFNHQTHHRGQATTLLTQAGIDVGVTDLLALLPEVE